MSSLSRNAKFNNTKFSLFKLANATTTISNILVITSNDTNLMIVESCIGRNNEECLIDENHKHMLEIVEPSQIHFDGYDFVIPTNNDVKLDLESVIGLIDDPDDDVLLKNHTNKDLPFIKMILVILLRSIDYKPTEVQSRNTDCVNYVDQHKIDKLEADVEELKDLKLVVDELRAKVLSLERLAALK